MSSENTNLCPACDIGQLREETQDYRVTVSDDVKVVVPNLRVEVCDHCGEIVLSAEAAGQVDQAIAEQTEQLTPRELARIREDLDVDQTQMSEILGLGAKTYHRWEKGNQVPSRSMGYYLRVLAKFPEAFAWLRERGWKKENRVAARVSQAELELAFSSLRVGREIVIVGTAAPNRALALYRRAA